MKRIFPVLLAVIAVLVVIVTIVVGPFPSNGSTITQNSVDDQLFSAIAGDYQASPNDPNLREYWHLTILSDWEGYPYYLTIYDNSAGNPGVEGEVIGLYSDSMRIHIDPDYFDELPADWILDGEDLVLAYQADKDAIILTNNNRSATFLKES